MGRLGVWWGADREGITPDIMLVGKGLSGGIVPVSAMVATPEDAVHHAEHALPGEARRADQELERGRHARTIARR